MFANRAAREAQAPFWYSLWRIRPDLYNQYTHAAAVGVLSLIAYLRYFRGRLTFLEALVLVEFAFLLAGNYINFDRVNTVLVLPLVASQSGRFLKIYSVSAFLVLHAMAALAYLRLFNNQVDAWFVPNMVLVNGCLVLYVGYLSCKADVRAVSGAPAQVTKP
jgi:hypothetical protein